MARALWLPTVLREAGLTVHEEPGWKTRGYDGFAPVAVVCHATAGSTVATDRAEINVIAYNGSSTAPAPIAQLYLSRSGEIWVIASGTCNHIGDANLPGTGQAGNNNAIGIEAANNNRGEPWPAAQYEAYVRAVAAICRHMGWTTARVFGHKEISYTGKTDPTFNMTTFRSRVAVVLSGEGDVTAQDVWTYDPNDPKTGVRNPSWRPDAATNATVKPSYAVAGIWDEAHEAAVAARTLVPLVQSLVASHTGSSLEQVQAMMRAELDAAAVREREERAAEYSALGERLAATVTERFGDDVGRLVAEEFKAAVHRGTAPESTG